MVVADFGFSVNDLLQPLEDYLQALIGKFMQAAEAVAKTWLSPLDTTLQKYNMTMGQLKHWGPFGATQSAMTVFDQFRSVSVDPNVGTTYSIGAIPRDTGGTTYQGTGSVQPWGWSPQSFTVPQWVPSGNPWPSPSPGASPSPGSGGSPSPTAVSQIQQAESGDCISCTVASPSQFGYTSSACVGQFVESQSGTTWNDGLFFTNMVAGDYTLTIHYSEPGPDSHLVQVGFDGSTVEMAYLVPTGDFNTWGFTSSVSISVPASSPYPGYLPSTTHYVRLDGDTGTGDSPWIDYVEIDPATSVTSSTMAARRMAASTGRVGFAGTLSHLASVSATPGLHMVAANPNYRGLSSRFLGFDQSDPARLLSTSNRSRSISTYSTGYTTSGFNSPGASLTGGSASGMLKLDFSPFDPSTGQGTFLGSVRTMVRLLLGGLVWVALLFWIVRTLTVKFSS